MVSSTSGLLKLHSHILEPQYDHSSPFSRRRIRLLAVMRGGEFALFKMTPCLFAMRQCQFVIANQTCSPFFCQSVQNLPSPSLTRFAESRTPQQQTSYRRQLPGKNVFIRHFVLSSHS